jgi:signal transduction histidine kinase
MKHTILCVDDEIDNVEALERIFRTKFHVLKATSGMQALSILDQHPDPIAVIITDQRMPQMTGVEFLAQSLKSHADTVRILLTGYTDMESIIAAVNSGQIYRYLNKPWDPVDLLNTVERACERFVLQQELKIKNVELAKAFSELQTLDQAKNQFMILINHELKTPLTSILSFSELLQETELTEEQELCLSRIRKSADRLRDLIDDVLLIVSAETKILKPKIQPFEVSTLLNPIPKNLQTSFDQKNQKLVREIKEDKKVVADPFLVSQIIERILHNASKFGKENSEIHFEAVTSQPHRLKIKVYNQGPSIAPQVIDKILQPFFLDEDVMNHSIGLGLGLTICQALLRVHQSQLFIENRLGGVEVFFELPCL